MAGNTGTFNNLNNTTENGTVNADTFTLTGNGTTDIFNLFDGNDTVTVGAGGTYINQTVYGGAGDDAVQNLGNNSLIYGNQGVDTISFANATNRDTVYGGQGNDAITATSGNSFLIYGNLGNDTVNLGGATGVVGSSTIYGGQGNDIITGSSGTDYINGGQDNDTITSGAGTNNTLIGGVGRDTITSNGTAALIYGNQNDDAITSNANLATVYGGQGTDTITVAGAAATPTVTNNIIYGNLGDDAVSLTNANTSTVYGGQGVDTITITGSGTAGAAATGTDVGANNVVYGDLGNDVINAGANESTIFGGQGDDQITASNQFDTISGGDGRDLLNITGAVVTPANAAATPPVTSQALTISDFVTGQDTITLGGGAGTSQNFSTATVNGGLDQAITAAQSSTSTYTFVAGSSDGFIFFKSGGNLTGAVLTGDNTLASFNANDIAG